ncbi:MAG: tagatose 3-epimerase [Ramlibacter sp.]|jgi:sugar phosphate isomerase/epimerase|nr:tagatose 3-epimerase [Ramlibacter sp.]
MKFALCNEVLQPLPFARQCKLAADLGYDGLEVAPFTLAEDPMSITDQEAAAFRKVAEDHGLRIHGLHWLLVAPAGLSIVSEDASLRRRTTDVMQRLVELCVALGGSYLVHGSPKQRSVPAGSTREQAWERARECLRAAGEAAARCGVTYCLEPLAPRETDLFNTVEEAARMVDEIGLPALRTMIDCSAAGQAEAEPVHALMERWMPRGVIGHVQVNDPNRRGPGQGAMAFGPILQVMRRMEEAGHFPGIVGVEPFDYVPDGPGCAAHSIGYLRGVLQGLQSHG